MQRLLEEEVDNLLGRKKSERRGAEDSRGYRNGYAPPRKLALSSGTITVERPRVRDMEERFVSRLLPLFKRRTEEIGALLRELYLHGLSLGDFELVYLWADGIYVKAGLEKEKAALLVLIGANSSGEKLVLAVEIGHRESSESWANVLRDLKARGLVSPKLTVADGHLGIWGALGAVYPTSAEQRCWNHKMRNVLDVVALKHQAEVKAHLQQIAGAESRQEAERLKCAFRKAYERMHPKAIERLEQAPRENGVLAPSTRYNDPSSGSLCEPFS